MSLLIFSVNLFWGGCATYCFHEAWLAVLGLAACAIGLFRQRIDCGVLLSSFYNQVTLLLINGLALRLVFAVFWSRWGLGRTPSETLAFLIAASIVMAYLLPRIPERIDRIWRITNGPD